MTEDYKTAPVAGWDDPTLSTQGEIDVVEAIRRARVAVRDLQETGQLRWLS